MSAIIAVARRELGSYFSTPLAYVFLVIFLVLAGLLTFYAGDFYDRNLADLQPFFAMHPWLYLVLVPAVAMPLWAEESRSGTIELLLTMPLSTTQAMLGKFLAAWAFVAIALVLTFPIWITVNYLGRSGQRRDPGKLPRQLADGRRIPGHRHLHVGGHVQPDHRLPAYSQCLLPVAVGRPVPGA